MGLLNSAPVPNLPLLIPRPHLPQWRRYQGKWTTWRGYQPPITTTLQPAGTVPIGAGSGSNQPPPLQQPHSLSAPGSRPWQVPGRGLGLGLGEKEGKGWWGGTAGVVSVYLDDLEDGKRVIDTWNWSL